MKIGYIYILSNSSRTVNYIGVTSNLELRILAHKALAGSVFSKKYRLTSLVYYERIFGMQNAINREKQLKRWHKEWKWELIKEENPDLIDIAAKWYSAKEIEEYKINNPFQF